MKIKNSKTALKLVVVFLLTILGFSEESVSAAVSAVSNSSFSTSLMVNASSSARKKSSGRRSKSSRNKSGNRRKSTGKRSSSAQKKSSTRTTVKKAAPAPVVEYPQNDSLTLRINQAVIAGIPQNQNPGGLRVNSVRPDARLKTAKVSLNENFTYLPVTQELINEMTRTVRRALPDSISDYGVMLSVGNKNLAYYINRIDKLPAAARVNVPFVVETDPLADPHKGMKNDIVALWHSHGRYYKPSAAGWMWQRPLLFETIEDIYTMGYILPFVVPMLENAGAYVLLPRERDINKNEIIIDNDTNEGGQLFSQTTYREMNGTNKWQTGEGEGFIYDLPDFRDTENPFENGTYRQAVTVKDNNGKSVAGWYGDIPEEGEYAVYVSYKTLPNSTDDARYTVYYSGGSKEFKVNQTMGGGTWIYLGTFPFEAGYSDSEPLVTLTNQSHTAGKVVTADAVKIGGGMGNIARSPRRSDIYYDPSTPDSAPSYVSSSNSKVMASVDDEDNDEDEEDEDGDDEGTDDTGTTPASDSSKVSEPQRHGPAPVFKTSGYPRYLEGARYWLHWAGFPEDVYSPYHGSDDYKDDYTSRGKWVNYLAGGSRVLPGRKGLNIPVDVAMALHSDAGKKSDDSFVGTLGIYFTNNGDSYTDGTARINSRMLADLLLRQITGDIRQTYEPRWTRRSMWDKSYVEARVPEVPTALIELLSHQNFADMQYGLDPGFRFTVGRAIYKALARFVAQRKDREVVIQPLPIKDFMIEREKKNHYKLSWTPTPDPLEPTAMPTKYIIMERSGDELGFHKIGETHSTHYNVKTTDHDIHSFRVIAVNDGGISFPSETLAFREGENDRKQVLVINGFDRVSGPGHFSDDGRAGFDSENDFGVPYIRDISFSGHQTEFRRGAGESFGRSSSSYADKVIAGNTFDYPALHGRSIAASGYGFVSASASAVEKGEVKLSDFKNIDLILGKQKTTVVGNGKSGRKYEAIPQALRHLLERYVDGGGNLIVSGAYIVSDLNDYRNGQGAATFARNVLGVAPDSLQSRARLGRLTFYPTSGNTVRQSVGYSATLNNKQYIVERPDMLVPVDYANSKIILTFEDNGKPAGITTRKGKSTVTVMSVPFESLTDERQRNLLMNELLED